MQRFPPEDLHGIHAVVYALFGADEQLDRAAMRQQVQACLACGVHGMVALGLATEVSKLSEAERRTVMDWVAEDTAGKVPLACTIFGASVAEQLAQVRHAQALGADWVILQPPAVGTFGAAEYIRFFGRVAQATHLPVAIQNAPAFLGRGLSADEIRELLLQHPNIRCIKGEGPVVEVAALIERTGGQVPVFNGRGGLELIDNLRAGCRGMILAPDCIDYAVRAYAAWRRGDAAQAEYEYARMLPATVFVMQGLENLLCYGKRLFAARAGIGVHDRSPALRPTPVGQAMLARFAQALGPLPAQRAGGPQDARISSS
ncbi:dihydrodipicolinate synthase family protein [Verminephrobacter aporrectodeae]|uniref:dihydrodipicolinate synthase family protein n=1 Tax=Verminephrobacter aporrectodeae TaxID=1110389 RepID=UPI002242C696|nr:dihydrodipicolinate synthase family protein [Verminephrobacter aporrectodeae]MCW8173806.1 dihydrodipicolinate synthase family protein [Verminephrobacter aporrectodeae subsp. tuberculatae]MCW8201377.1 dihydrodipicolinate synthase family protein [Verminephrobacter aporrectodeae subsp. tuberculatae]